jgi:demethylmenaquinone methyltransferase/2-methoxy-6-polyprenyl-1,4-benzoquinol methylase
MRHDRQAWAGASEAIPVFSQSLGSWRLTLDRCPFDQDALAEQCDRQSGTWQQVIERHGFAHAYADLIAAGLSQRHNPGPRRSLRVLDAGVGTGAMSAALRAQVAGPLRLDAVDISGAMLTQAQTRLAHPETELHLRRASLACLPYAANSFDVVLAAHVIEHLPDPHQALQEIQRVLKPGGLLIASITRTSLMGAFVQVMWRTHRIAPHVALRWLRRAGLCDARLVPYGPGTPARRFSQGYVACKPSAARVAA